MTKFNWTK